MKRMCAAAPVSNDIKWLKSFTLTDSRAHWQNDKMTKWRAGWLAGWLAGWREDWLMWRREGKVEFVAGSNQLDAPLTFASTCEILRERNERRELKGGKKWEKYGTGRTQEDCEWEGEKYTERDVTESNVSSSDFTVYWSRKHWTLDEILIRSERNRGIEKIKG